MEYGGRIRNFKPRSAQVHRHIARPGLEERASRHAPRRRDSEGLQLVFTAALGNVRLQARTTLVFTAAMRDVHPKPRLYDDSDELVGWARAALAAAQRAAARKSKPKANKPKAKSKARRA